jgi:myo-inositol 2-dehydrogenase/D-chiro-inositol 1-dehydrogenase
VRALDRPVDPHARPWPDWQERFATAYREEMRAFLAAVAGTGDVEVTVDDGLRAERIAEAAAESLQSGRRIDVRD